MIKYINNNIYIDKILKKFEKRFDAYLGILELFSFCGFSFLKLILD